MDQSKIRPARLIQTASKTAQRGAGDAVPLTVSRPELMPDDTDRAFRQLVHRMLAFSARLETVRAHFGAMIGLSGIQYTALISIAHLSRDAAVGVKELADHLGLSGSFVTLVVGQLTALGLVDKLPDPADRRRVQLSVTNLGLEKLKTLAPMQTRVNDVLFSPLDAEQFGVLNRVFADLIQSGASAVNLLDYVAGGGDAVLPVARSRAVR